MYLAIGVTASNSSTYNNTPSLLSTPEILPQLELPVPPNNTAGPSIPSDLLPPLPLMDEYQQRVKTLRQQVESLQQMVETPFLPSPIAADLSVAQLLAHICSGIDLNQPVFREGSITYQNLQNINRNTHPEFFTNSSDAVDNNYEQPCLEELEIQGGRGETPANTRPIGNPLKDSRIRAQLG